MSTRISKWKFLAGRYGWMGRILVLVLCLSVLGVRAHRVSASDEQERPVAIDISDDVRALEKELREYLATSYKSPDANRGFRRALNARNAEAFYAAKMKRKGWKANLALPFYAITWTLTKPLAMVQKGSERAGYRVGYSRVSVDSLESFVEKGEDLIRLGIGKDVAYIAAGVAGFLTEAVGLPYMAGSALTAHLAANGVIAVSGNLATVNMEMLGTYLQYHGLCASTGAVSWVKELPKTLIVKGIPFLGKNAVQQAVNSTISAAVGVIIASTVMGRFQQVATDKATIERQRQIYEKLLEFYSTQKQMYESGVLTSVDRLETLDLANKDNTYNRIRLLLLTETTVAIRESRAVNDSIQMMHQSFMTSLKIIDTHLVTNKILINQLLEKRRTGGFTREDRDEILRANEEMKLDLIQSYNVTANWLIYALSEPVLKDEMNRHLLRFGFNLYRERYAEFLEAQISAAPDQQKLEQASRKFRSLVTQNFYRADEIKEVMEMKF